MNVMPKILTVGEIDFPISDVDLPGYGTGIRLPNHVRTMFEKGAHVVRIRSLTTARKIPDRGGRTGGTRSLLIHKDHLATSKEGQEKPARFIMLSKSTEGERRSSTVFMLAYAAKKVLAIEEEYFNDGRRRRSAARERAYDERFRITEEQYHRCFSGDYEQIVAEVVAQGYTDELAVRLGILGYLMRGTHADKLMEQSLERIRGLYLELRVETGDIVIIDNEAGFHGRRGINDPLQRNFCT